MALNYGFFNSRNGDRKYDARWFAKYFASFIGNGVFPNPSTGLQVVEGEHMTVIVKPGDAWINGYYANNDSDYHITLDNADGLLKRIDRIVMRWNQIDRVMEIVVKKGAFSENPVAQPIQRDVEYYELVLADVYVNKGVTQITQAHITDTRLNNELCGIVHGLVNQVDTTTLFVQYQSWIQQQKEDYELELATWTANQRLSFEQWMLQQEGDWLDWQDAQNQDFLSWRDIQQTDFNAWYASVQNILDGDVAANLTNQIAQTNNNLSILQQQVTTHLAQYEDFKKTAAVLDETGNLPSDNLGNIGELADLYGRAVQQLRFTKNHIFDYIKQKLKVNLFEFVEIDTSEFFKTVVRGTNNAVSFSKSMLVVESHGQSAPYQAIAASNFPIDLTNVNEIAFSYRRHGNTVSANKGEAKIGLQRELSGDNNFDTLIDMSNFEYMNEFDTIILDTRNLSGEFYLKFYVAGVYSDYGWSRIYLNGVTFNPNGNLVLNQNYSVALSDEFTHGELEFEVEMKPSFLNWHSLNALIDVPLYSNIRFDIYNNYGVLLKSDVKNGETFKNFTDPILVVKLTFTRETISTFSPILFWLEMGMRGISSSDFNIIYETNLTSAVASINFDELEEYTELEIEYIPNSNATTNITLTYNDVKTSSYNYTGTNNTGTVGSTSAIPNIPITTGLGRHTLIKVDNTNTKKSGNVEISSYLKTGTLGMFKINGHFALDQLISSIQLTAAFPIGSRFIVRGKKEWRS